jgi:hypothetical protein
LQWDGVFSHYYYFTNSRLPPCGLRQSSLIGVSASGRNHKRQLPPNKARSWEPKCRENDLFGRKLTAGFNGESSDTWIHHILRTLEGAGRDDWNKAMTNFTKSLYK